MHIGAKLTSSGLVMVNFICQLDWAKGYQIVGKTLFPGISVRLLPEEMSIWTGELHKVDGPPQCEETSFSPFQTQIEGGQIPSLCLNWDTHLLLPSDNDTPSSRPFRLRSEFTPLAPWFSDLWTQTELHQQLSCFATLQSTDHGTSWLPNHVS